MKKDNSSYEYLVWQLRNGLEAGLMLWHLDEDGEPVWYGKDEDWKNYQELMEK